MMKRIIFTLWMITLVSVFSAWTQTSDLTYSTSGNYATVTKCNTSATHVIIPSTITKNGTVYSVKYIGNKAFEYCSNLISINIPQSVTSIGYDAFSNCSSLNSVTVPNSVTSIGSYAFYLCRSLTSVTIPESITSIENGLFNCCFILTSVIIPSNVTSIGDKAFSNCSSLISVTISGSVNSIGNQAFSSCSSLTSINIPESVTTIGNQAFSSCSSLTSINIPGKVTNIERRTFYYCSSLTSITIPQSVTSIGEDAFSGCSSLTLINIPSEVTSIGSSAFYGCSSLTSINIPSGVTSIGSTAFYGCNSLTSINILSGVTSIGNSAFQDCSNLTSITIPESVTSIGSHAFQDCSSLTSITIPESVTSIGSHAFYGCSSLTSIYCNAYNPPALLEDPSWGKYFFSNYNASLYVPESSLELYKNAPYWRYFLITLSKKYHSGYLNTVCDNPIWKNYNDIIKGVTADGASTIEVVVNDIPDDVSFNYYGVSSIYASSTITGYCDTYRRENGKLTFVYHAPPSFPEEISGNEYNVTIVVSMIDPANGEWIERKIDISVIRPPVLLTHGLNSDASCFANFNKALLESGMYKDFQILRTNYSGTNTQYFAYNQNVVRNHLKTLFENCLRNGYVSAKADLIGHSMGGILSRLHAQYVSRQEVNKIITLNTPHSGSQLANLKNLMPFIIMGGAYNDLQAGSSATDNYLNNSAILSQTAGTPVHAVSSTEDISDNLHYGSSLFINIIKLYSLINRQASAVTGGMNLLLSAMYNGDNDFVVALNSQNGGLSGSNTSFISNAWHSASSNDSRVWNRLIELLRLPPDNSAFAKRFNPPKLTFAIDAANPSTAPLRTARRSQSSESYITIAATAHFDGSKKTVEITTQASSDVETRAVYTFFSKDEMFVDSGKTVTIDVPDKYAGNLTIYAVGRTTQNEYVTDSAVVQFDNSHLTPCYIYLENTDTLYLEIGDTHTPRVICGWDDNTESEITPTLTSESGIIAIDNNSITGLEKGRCTLNAQFGEFQVSRPVNVIDSTRYYTKSTGIEEIHVAKTPPVIHYSTSQQSLAVTFPAEYAGLSKLDVYDLSGKCVYSRKEQISAVPGETRTYPLPLHKGLYIVRMALDNETVRQKIMVR